MKNPCIVKKEVRATTRGADINSPDCKYDGHVRLEEGEIFVDIFKSNIKNPDRAHRESQSFPRTKSGATDATDYIREGYGFRTKIIV